MLSSSPIGSGIGPEQFRLLSGWVAGRTGLRLNESKIESVARKVAQRVEALGLRDPAEYFARLGAGTLGAAELEELAETLANHETYFFREAAQLEAFLSHVAPGLADGARRADRPVRVLSLGCATGEEPFSLSILERELRVDNLDVRFEIHGADIGRGVLERAGQGTYGATSFRSLESAPRERARIQREYLQRYFEPVEEDRFRLRSAIRRTVAFHRVNLMQGGELASLGSFDAILCRNVLIYFGESAVEVALANIARCLYLHGVLLVGQAESLVSRTDRFQPHWLGSAMVYRVVHP